MQGRAQGGRGETRSPGEPDWSWSRSDTGDVTDRPRRERDAGKKKEKEEGRMKNHIKKKEDGIMKNNKNKEE